MGRVYFSAIYMKQAMQLSITSIDLLSGHNVIVIEAIYSNLGADLATLSHVPSSLRKGYKTCGNVECLNM